jgi:hypothetical protein
MTTISIPGFIHAKPAKEWELGFADIVDGHRMDFSTVEDRGEYGWILVCPHTMTFELPEGWDPRAQQIDALKQEKKRLLDEIATAIMKIDAQISKLQAIEYTPAEVA